MKLGNGGIDFQRFVVIRHKNAFRAYGKGQALEPDGTEMEKYGLED